MLVCYYYNSFSLSNLDSTLHNRNNMVIMDNYYLQDRLSELWNRIDKLHLTYLDIEENPEKIEIRCKLEDLIKEYLCIAAHNQKFTLPVTYDVLYRSAHGSPNFSGYKAAMGFNALQMYAGNLFSQPWRREYKQIRKYSGFFKHHVEANLVNSELLLEAMGYKRTGQSTLILDGPIGPDRVLSVSKDCLIAYVECQILKVIWEEITSSQMNVSWAEILDFRQAHLCSVEQSIKGLRYQYQQKHFRNNSQGTFSIHHGPSYFSNSSQPPVSIHEPHMVPQYFCGTNGCCPTACMAYAQMQCPHSQVLPYTNQHIMKPQFNTNGYYYANGLTPHASVYNSTVPIGQLIEVEPQNGYDIVDRPSHSRTTLRSHNAGEAYTNYNNEELIAKELDKTDSQLEDWRYVYEKLETQAYNKDLGERGDLLADAFEGLKVSDKKKKEKDQRKSKGSIVDHTVNNLTVSNRSKQKEAPKVRKSSDIKLSPASSYDNILPGEKKGAGKLSNASTSKSKFSNIDKTPSSKQMTKTIKRDEKSKVKESKPDNSSWQCKTCTFLNNSSRSICEICGKSKKNVEDEVQVGGAECEKCTLVNPKNVKVCQACAHSLENSPTRV